MPMVWYTSIRATKPYEYKIWVKDLLVEIFILSKENKITSGCDYTDEVFPCHSPEK